MPIPATLRFARLLACSALLALGAAGTTSCEKSTCGCTPPPREPVTTAAFTSVTVWWLNEVSSGGQLTSAEAIKDRYSMQFKPDGTYVQTLLADGTTYRGTWMLMGTDNRTLHLTDHKGTAQEYTVESVTTAKLVYGHPAKHNQPEMYSFGPARK
ncbi:hypothetical protein [Hymenobacter metallilatus]|uniref:Lipocalin-like domain-containing protein n=1 Tax=Hymenobacter metallilatus TaxID=2493666 RepID=A0A428JRP6_9BACT|nr:hypothetical protein [Hymenobacter metallilatus]RSK36320.1 hypothetical protein EI290_05410 [Hymenobacter metallilatus]